MPTQTRHIVAEVPYEVWRIVAGFLSSQDAKNLYGINRPLSALAMEERYRSASIGDVHDPETIVALQRLTDQRRAKYVRVLNFRPTPLAAHLSIGRWKYWIRKISKKLGILAGRKTAFDTRPQALLNVISNLSFVTSLTLECHCIDYAPSFMKSLPFIAAGWASFGSTLRFLHLRLPLEALHDTISSVKLPSLQGLSINFLQQYRNTDGPKIILGTVIPFINNHADALRSLDLHTWGFFNLFKPLQQIVCIPMLDNFTLFQGSYFERTDLFGLHSFLSTHSRTLKILDVQFCSYDPEIPYDAWFTTPCFRVALPELQSLVLKFWVFSDEHAQGAVNYVAQYSDTLTSLNVTSVHFSYDQIDELATLLSTKGRLQNLALMTKIFSPQILVLLFNKFPVLDELTLKFYRLAAQMGGVRDYNAANLEFCKGIGNIFVREWKVHNLVLNGSLNVECKRALVAALPNIRTFNGNDREVYLSKADWDEGTL